ncbi:30S ribosomal protein S6 [candidate division WS6 bacterium RIFOXYD1_FULL_33_8]|uniref:Small ribosomal subunit protein bS6 n=2 Tax=Candidatus Dojkabacteria TaxID=74243 RepID=A0A0G0AFX1_9BACT|nr:MAG: 30S ribosomal protein S6, small subunit ribosomal protein S6 [candidate division WS6 bacterium GW2011_GWE2_33_157]KKP44685.1 MAG: 30S ribosomal protein S6, small subunit ribosomal protein S6 [candidate division WS6 bacterium GW2011_GWC1_33_20]KKP45974.1 MAG: 30S ribosomal protein S6, small subunit ribosomal protein S6 [candidate division WS6 bacterium GW2011_GWF1_33_233]KKP55513.1 MAG: 30S ribosomal protein S6 [candidate division WS6 bacterium GW2011_GWB1_33_6]KKP55594.1 MAG: 30S riboso
MLVEREKQFKNYEMMVVFKPLLPDDLRKSIHKEFMDMMEQGGGEVLDVDVWGKRYLSFKIQGHNEGYYIVYNFRGLPKNINEMKRLLQLKQEILRFMIVESDNPGAIGKGIKKKEIEV